MYCNDIEENIVPFMSMEGLRESKTNMTMPSRLWRCQDAACKRNFLTPGDSTPRKSRAAHGMAAHSNPNQRLASQNHALAAGQASCHSCSPGRPPDPT